MPPVSICLVVPDISILCFFECLFLAIFKLKSAAVVLVKLGFITVAERLKKESTPCVNKWVDSHSFPKGRTQVAGTFSHATDG